MKPIRNAAELYAHAIAIEREAAERYAEFAERMSDLGNDAVAELFGRLAEYEAEHLDALLRRTDGVALPAIASQDYRWLDSVAPETAARKLVFRLLTPHQAVVIALRAERRAQAFFEEIFVTADDPALRALAQEMAAEEREHVVLVENLLSQTREGNVDWATVAEGADRVSSRGPG